MNRGLWQLSHPVAAHVRAGLRTYLVFVAGANEGLEPRGPLLRDMCLLSAGVFLQVFLVRKASRTALAAGGPTASIATHVRQSSRHSSSRTR